MSRGLRCMIVWLAVSLGAAAATWLLRADLVALGRAATWQRGFDVALVPACAAVAVACAAWFWCVTTVTAVEVLRGASPGDLAARGGAARRLVLALCGVAVATQLAAPAHAAQGQGPDERPSLAGLAVPDRAAVGVVRSRGSGVARPLARPLARPGFRDLGATAAAARPRVVVQPGDSLWSIAEDALGPDADVPALVDHWHRTYAANRQVVGTDPDLIHPGQQLSLPPGTAGSRHRPGSPSSTPSTDDSDHEEQR